MHRIVKDGVTVHVMTLRFSTIDSYTDPNHLWHLSSEWYRTMTDYYLQVQVSRVTHIKGKNKFWQKRIIFHPSNHYYT